MENDGSIAHLDKNDQITGTPQIVWETWDRPAINRGRSWYLVAFFLAGACIVYALLGGNYIFALIILMFGMLLILRGIYKPKRILTGITDQGIVVNETFYPYELFKWFSICYRPPETKKLYLTFTGRFTPQMSIDLEDIDPSLIREYLINNLLENSLETEESLTDLLTRVYKL